MNDELKKELNELKNTVNCEKGFKCIANLTQMNCAAKYHAQADLMECLEVNPVCPHAKAFSSTYSCMCLLRKKIAINIEKI